MSKVTVTTLQAHKAAGEKFSVIAAYDATFAGLIEEAGIEVILVGDSLGMVVQGHSSTLPVTMDEMVYHTGCISRGCKAPLIIGDLPFGSYSTLEQTLTNAAALMRAGANMVKLEGGEWLLESITAMTERGIPVCAHLGLTPQSVNAFGGFKVQGRNSDQAAAILEDAKRVEAAGASMLVLECIPSELAVQITQALSIPVIGIGAGADTDAQVLVLYDMLGLCGHKPKFVRNFLADNDSVQSALKAYNDAVKEGTFPAAEHGFS
ncbi:3-methyl-2-oxobutanoate hydroxymethyltransferase [Oceanicoccus sagamiensis]|uniref:3-methyl-2-oxobutanoate hydroxymethyltransferase n=1 Tax=Oceanicoccus sagamiensis TaxID=716816 RepID=A0A1X9N5W5_9GAMM|nr:3-methyl-2-oxobutanoate hydroxymethyltransferase [Oceanicoccus sagamiensis]ARN73490.1 3-methyl-2-oxobutanoate hydroxymethyltransferase [Oceanicoccus sagamiensis]